ncbi:MAG: hypothetical protein QXS54_01750, partial [Candidatus Methanomethylicaceae archaeon]
EQTRYWVTSCLKASLEEVIGHAAQRWSIEVLFADFKELVGSDQYQMRSAEGIVRFWALGWCVIQFQFLDEIRAEHYRQTGERLTLGQARERVRLAHQQKVLDWIVEQIQSGATCEDIYQALKPAMQL